MWTIWKVSQYNKWGKNDGKMGRDLKHTCEYVRLINFKNDRAKMENKKTRV